MITVWSIELTPKITMRMILNKLPWILAVASAALTCWMFWLAHVDAAQYGMAPVLVFIVDVPATFVGLLIVRGLALLFGDTCWDSPCFIVFLIVGFAWYYLIGWGLRWLIRSVHNRREAARRGFDVILPTRTPNSGTGTTGGAANGTGTGNEPN